MENLQDLGTMIESHIWW